MSISTRLISMFDNQAKRLTLAQLRSKSERHLIDCGFSPKLLQEGIKAWPWRDEPEALAPLLLNQLTPKLDTSTSNAAQSLVPPERNTHSVAKEHLHQNAA